jgi:SAM-dependent methyltransferase
MTDFPDEWYALNQADHFWFAWRLRALQRLLSDRAAAAQVPLRALDVGCGIGFLRSQIESITRWTIDGVDLNESALQKALPSRGRTLLYNIEDRSEVLKEQYDVVILFDVVEHIDDPAKFLAAALWHLKPGGRVIINVPALRLLYSRYDQLVGHFRRYDRRSLRQLLENPAVGLQPVDMRYWGFSLVPIAWLRKFALRKSQTPEEAVAIGFNSRAQWINQLFGVAMHIETGILQHPWVGSSLMALAYKPASVKARIKSGV